MKKTYQGTQDKSKRKFEVIGKREMVVDVPLTVHRLGVGGLLRQTLASTNPIESCFSIVGKVARNVKRWRAGDHALRWTATGLREAEKKFHRVKGYRELQLLQRKLNPSLTQKEQVA